MTLYDWTNERYTDLLQMALDLKREGHPPQHVFDALVAHCLERECTEVLLSDLSRMVALVF